jgi:hypothetical protein
MDIYMPMSISTTVRHNKIVTTLMNRIFKDVESGELHALQEECSLVYWGKSTEPMSVSLVAVKEIEDLQRFTEITIEDLYYVQPDLMIFKSNLGIINQYTYPLCGCLTKQCVGVRWRCMGCVLADCIIHQYKFRCSLIL